MSIEQTSAIATPTDPATIKRIKDCMLEVSGSMTRIAGEREFIKEAIKDLAKEVELPKSYLNKMSKLYHRQNISQVAADQEALNELYGKIFDVEV